MRTINKLIEYSGKRKNKKLGRMKATRLKARSAYGGPKVAGTGYILKKRKVVK